MSQRRGRKHITLVVSMKRFRPPEHTPAGDGLDDNRPAPAEFGSLLARIDGINPRLTDQPLSTIGKTVQGTTLEIGHYHHMPLILDESVHSGHLNGVRQEGEKRYWSFQIDTPSRLDLVAVWAMATIFLEGGNTAFFDHPSMRKWLGHFEPRTIDLLPAVSGSPAPYWQLDMAGNGTLSLIIPQIQDDFPREVSQAMAHYALLAALEARFSAKTKEQLGQPDARFGQATRRIMSAASFLHG